MKTTVILLLYCIVAAAQLYACIPPGRERLRYATKPLLMPLLALFLLLCCQPAPLLMIAGLLLGFLGDLLLLYSDDRPALFVPGSLSFAAGHVCYTGYFLSRLGSAPDLRIVLIAVPCYAAAILLLLRTLRRSMPRRLLFAAGIYLVLISCMSISALLFAADSRTLWHWLVYGATLLFLFSDGFLSYEKFCRSFKCRHLVVMLTYLLAQTGIALGVFMTQGGQ